MQEAAKEDIFEAIVIGAGVMGSATAYLLSKELGNKVLLLEQFDFLHKKGSSHGESRIIRTTYPEEHYTYLMKEAYKLWGEVETESGSTVITRTGGLDISTRNNREIQSVLSSARKYSVPLEVLSNEQVMQRFPTIKLKVKHIGVYSRDAGIINATKAVAMFQTLARHHGCKLLDNTAVAKIEKSNGGGHHDYTLVQTGSGKIFLTRKLIVTAGAWTRKLLKGCEELTIPLHPIKTTVAYWKIKDAEHAHAYSYERFPVFINYGDPNVYGIPAAEYPGLIKCSAHYGPPCDPDKRNFEPDQKGLADVKRFLEKTFSGVELTPTMTESCMYTLSLDHGFIIDNIPSSRDILIGCGFSGHGFKLAPVVAKILTSLALTGKHPYPEIEQHFRLDRFTHAQYRKSNL